MRGIVGCGKVKVRLSVKREVCSPSTEPWAVGWERADYIWKMEGTGREQLAQPPAMKRGYLGTRNTICARETTATRSTLQEERRSVSSDMRHGARTGGGEGGTYTLARGSGQASRSRFTSGSSLSFFPSRARGSLNTSGALERAERRGQPVVRVCPGASFKAGLRLGLQHQELLFLPGSPSRGSQAAGLSCRGTYRLSFGTSVSFVAGSTRFTLREGRRV